MTDQGAQLTQAQEDPVTVVLVGTNTGGREDQPTMDPGVHDTMDREVRHIADPGGQPMMGREDHVTQVQEVHAIQAPEAQGSFAQGFVVSNQ